MKIYQDALKSMIQTHGDQWKRHGWTREAGLDGLDTMAAQTVEDVPPLVILLAHGGVIRSIDARSVDVVMPNGWLISKVKNKSGLISENARDEWIKNGYRD